MQIDWIEPQKVYNHSISSYFAYIVKILANSPISRDALMEYLKEKNVETTIMFRPIHMQPYYKSKFNIQNRYPNAEFVGTNTLVLPLHAGMTIEDAEYVMSALRNVKK